MVCIAGKGYSGILDSAHSPYWTEPVTSGSPGPGVCEQVSREGTIGLFAFAFFLSALETILQSEAYFTTTASFSLAYHHEALGSISHGTSFGPGVCRKEASRGGGERFSVSLSFLLLHFVVLVPVHWSHAEFAGVQGGLCWFVVELPK